MDDYTVCDTTGPNKRAGSIYYLLQASCLLMDDKCSCNFMYPQQPYEDYNHTVCDTTGPNIRAGTTYYLVQTSCLQMDAIGSCNSSKIL